MERPMKPFHIIKLEIVVQATPSSLNRVIRVKIDILIFHCPPETLNVDVVKHSACPSPTDANVSRFIDEDGDYLAHFVELPSVSPRKETAQNLDSQSS